MLRKTALLWWHLNVLTKRRYEAIQDVYESLDEATEHMSEEFLRGLGVRADAMETTLRRLKEFDAETIEETLREKEVTLLTLEDDAYPKVLREIADPPPFLSYRGDLACLDQPLMALVGTRGMSIYGRQVVGRFVPTFVHAGMVTVSGLALGIDTAIAKETLRAGGKTIAVLGNGLSNIFPQRNQKLADEIVEKGGLIMSEFSPDQPPGTYTFPARNRIIAGLTLGTVVLEAPEGSGAIITAELALEYGREVFSVPGMIFDPNYAGCHTLISKGQAKLVTMPEDVLTEIGIIPPSTNHASIFSFFPSSETEKKVWETLTSLPQTVDDVVQKTGLSAAQTGTALTMMEIAGAVKGIAGGGWVRR